VGVEVSTQELGHFIGYPLQYQEWTNASEPQRVLGNGAPDWRQRTPGEIFDAIRSAGSPGQPVVVEVPHPYSYFDAYNVDPVKMEPGFDPLTDEFKESVVAFFNPLVERKNFSGRFDAMELINSKSFDLIRRPTVGDVRYYSRGLDALAQRKRSGTIDDATYQREVYALSTEVTRRILHRTPEEQAAAVAGLGNKLECKCGSDGDCAPGRVCDAVKLACVLPTDVSTGTPPPDEALCRSLRGVIDDWFNMLNRGVRRTGVSGSDVHSLYGYEAGCPRSLVRTTPTFGPLVSEAELVEGILAGRVLVTNGPMVRFSVNGHAIGETVTALSGEPMKLALSVETPGWFDVDRVEIYRNGSLIHWMKACTDKRSLGDDGHGHPCIQTGDTVRTALQTELEDAPAIDSWYVVMALGLDGRSLAPVYSSAAASRFGTFEVTQRVYDIVPRLSSLRIPRFPSLYPSFPIAITNPIYVDLGGGGWQAPWTAPRWCVSGRDVGCP
jgi:hypothetical protein